MHGEPYLTRGQLAAHLHIGYRTIQKLEKDGFPRHVWGPSGRIVRYRVSEAERWLGENAGP
jgi:phage terminase Nu1 subunit (DNA packaging protein)